MDTPKVAEQPTGRPCPLCTAPLVWRLSRYNKWFHACPNYFKTGCKGRIQAPRGATAPDASPPAPTPESLPPYVEAPPEYFPKWTNTPKLEPEETQMDKTTTDAGKVLYDLVAPAIIAEIEKRGAEIARRAIAESGSGIAKVEFFHNDIKVGEVEGKAHPALMKITKRASAGFRNFYIYGPAGAGKTYLGGQLAKALGLDFASLSATGGMPEWHLTGRSMPNLATGLSTYQPSRFVEMYEKGGVFLIDEVDSADPNVMIVINSALANGHMSVPARTENPNATRHENFYLIASANTVGKGADRMYVGRNQLDAAFLDRFVGCTIPLDYDRDLETAIISAISLGQATKVLDKVWAIRGKLESLKIRQIAGTRMAMAIARLVEGGFPLKEAISDCTVTWTADERSRVGVSDV